MKTLPARRRVQNQPLTGELIHRIMGRLFPKRNDYGSAGPEGAAMFAELVPELARFGITTRGKFQALMTHYRRKLLRVDRDPFSPWERRMFAEERGEAVMRDAERRQYWFAYPALVRIAAQMRFGEAAAVWAEETPPPTSPNSSS